MITTSSLTDEFSGLIESFAVLAIDARISHVLASLPPPSPPPSVRKTFLKNLHDWCERAKTVPWSDSDQVNFLEAGDPKKSWVLRFLQQRPTDGFPRSSSVLFAKTLVACGFDPCRYSEKNEVTLLGFSAYAHNAAVFSVFLAAAGPERGRLVLRADQLSPPLIKMAGSTLAHRVSERFIPANPLAALPTLAVIHRFDPAAFSVSDALGRLPEDAATSELSAILFGWRQEFEATTSRAALRASVSNLSGRRSEPPKI